MTRYIYLFEFNPGLSLSGNPPDGEEGEAYSFTFSASGGTSPYTWSVIDGSLPAGLSLGSSTGELSGTPTSGGDSTFTIQVEDSAGATASAEFTISIADVDLGASVLSKLVAWWEMDESSGDFIDRHTNSYDLTDIATGGRSKPTIRTGGTASTAFNAADSTYAGNVSGLQALPEISGAMDHAFFAWYRQEASMLNNSPIVSTNGLDNGNSSANSQGQLQIETDNKLAAVWLYGASNPEKSKSTRTISQDTDYFVGYCKNTADKEVTFYIDAVDETPISYTNEPDGGSDTDVWVGGYPLGGFNCRGRVQTVMAFEDSLTPGEVSWLYNGGAGRDYSELSS